MQGFSNRVPRAPVAPPRSYRLLFVLLAICSVLGIVVLFSVVQWAAKGISALTGAHVQARHFIDLVDRRQWREAYRLTSAEYQAEHTPEAFQKSLSGWSSRTGRIQSLKHSFQQRQDDAGSFATYDYLADGTLQDVRIKLRLRRENGEWRLDHYNFSPNK